MPRYADAAEQVIMNMKLIEVASKLRENFAPLKRTSRRAME